MTVTVSDVMRRVRNHFVTGALRREWRTVGGTLYPGGLIAPGSWIAIGERGPRGVYQLDQNGAVPGLPDRRWTGPIHLLEPPEDFLRLCGDIAAFAQQHTPGVQKESFSEYSVTYEHAGWEQAFAAQLAPYTRMYPEVDLG